MNKKEDFESNIKQLEEIVRKLEKGDAPLEQMLQMFEQGIALTRQCQKTLEQAEQRVSILLKGQQEQELIETEFHLPQES